MFRPASASRIPTTFLRDFSRASNTATENCFLTTEVQESNERTEGNVELRESSGKGWGVFALKNFKEGDIVMASKALKVQKQRDSHSVQTDFETHVKMDLPARFVNHSCGHANVGIQPNDNHSYDFLALREIERTAEILWDYETSEWDISTPFTCECGSLGCRGKLRGFRHNREDIILAFGEKWIAPYLQGRIILR